MNDAVAPTRPKLPWLEICLVALVPALDAVLRLGRLHPDEVYQVLEPALLKAFGYGTPAWEWQVGLRNWAVPGLFALLLKAASAVGVDDAWARRVVLEVPQYALQVGMLGAVWRFAARRGEPALARFSVWLVGLSAPLVWFAGRTLSESFSTAFLVWGLERLDADEGKGGPALWGGTLLGLGVVTRYGTLAAIVPALVWLAVTRRWRLLGLSVAGGAVVAFGLGLLDKLTWGATLPSAHFGGWWHSFAEYVSFNLLSGQAEQRFGASPWYTYLASFFVAPFAVVGLGAWWKRREARAWLFLASAVGYAVAISATAHKEPRFLYPVLELLSVAGAPGFVWFASEQLRRPRAWLGRSVAAAAVLGGAVYYLVPTPFDVQRAEQFQLIVRAGREGTGLVIMNEGLWGAGGSFYLGKPMPWCTCDFPQALCFDPRDARYNRAIYWEDPNNPQRTVTSVQAFEAMGFHEVEKRGLGHYLAR